MSTIRHPLRSLGPSLAAAGIVAALASPALAQEPPTGRPGVQREPLFEPTAIGEQALGMETPDLDEASYDIPGQFIVDARDDLGSGDILKLAGELGLGFTPTSLEAETRIQIATGMTAQALARLTRDPRVQHVEPLARVRAFFTPNDPLAKDQWHMDRVGAQRAWDFATGRGVTVAVVDTGIACEDHGPFMKGTDLAQTTCVGGWNLVKNNEHANDDQGHGTHVAGTIAQSTNNGLGAVGLAFHARLMPVKVLNELGWGTTADVADGIRWAADNGAHVINLSLGGPRNSKVMQDAIDHAVSRGVVVVAAAGNTGGGVQYPGASDGVIGVSATDSDDKLAKFSSRGDGVDLAAPGVNVVQQTVCNKGRDKCERFPGFSGTSMAAPHVAGAAALMVGLGITDPVAVEETLRSQARVVDDSNEGKKHYGAGILQAASAASHVTFVHAMVRLLALLGITFLVAQSARKLNAKSTSPWSLGFFITALAAGPGLFFFAPWVLPRVNLAVDLLARPIGDMDFFIGASLHRFLPFANALIPFGLTALLYGSKTARPAVAGFAVGTAAYLVSIAVLGEAASPFGRVGLIAWCVVNAAACAWIARTNLSESK